jgi:hypothetical protein
MSRQAKAAGIEAAKYGEITVVGPDGDPTTPERADETIVEIFKTSKDVDELKQRLQTEVIARHDLPLAADAARLGVSVAFEVLANRSLVPYGTSASRISAFEFDFHLPRSEVNRRGDARTIAQQRLTHSLRPYLNETALVEAFEAQLENDIEWTKSTAHRYSDFAAQQLPGAELRVPAIYYVWGALMSTDAPHFGVSCAGPADIQEALRLATEDAVTSYDDSFGYTTFAATEALQDLLHESGLARALGRARGYDGIPLDSHWQRCDLVRELMLACGTHTMTSVDFKVRSTTEPLVDFIMTANQLQELLQPIPGDRTVWDVALAVFTRDPYAGLWFLDDPAGSLRTIQETQVPVVGNLADLETRAQLVTAAASGAFEQISDAGPYDRSRNGFAAAVELAMTNPDSFRRNAEEYVADYWAGMDQARRAADGIS